MIRIGLMYPTSTPDSARSWSGTPAGLRKGLEANGAQVVPIGTRYSLPGRTAFRLGKAFDGFGGAINDRLAIVRRYRSKVLATSLAQAGPVDAVLAMGTDMYDLAEVIPSGPPVFTYDDATLAQMWGHPESDLRLVGFPERRVQHWIEQQTRSLRRADLCFASTRWAARGIEETAGIASKRICVVGMGHNPKTKRIPQRNWAEPRFLFVGLDWDRKNGDRVVAAFEQVKRTYPNAMLDIVGVERRIDTQGVRVHGILARDDAEAQRKLAGLYAQATCFAMPSKFDPSPISYLEAGSSGLPVIATSQGGASELLGEGSISVDPGEVSQIAQAMLRAADPGIAQQMSQHAEQAASQSTWVHVAQRMIEQITIQLERAPVKAGQ